MPGGQGLDETTLAELPGWLRSAYPELFEGEHLRERLSFYDRNEVLALSAHHPEHAGRDAAHGRLARLITGHSHLDGLVL